MEFKRLFTEFLEVKTDEKTGLIKGYGAAFGNKDKGGDIIEPGAIQRSIEEHKKNGTMPNMCYDHAQNVRVGDWLNWYEDSKGLPVEGKVWKGQGIPDAELAFNVANSTGEKGLSIGFYTKRATRDPKRNARILHEIHVKEISIVTDPMNNDAKILSVKSALEGVGETLSPREAEAILSDLGLSNMEAKKFISRFAAHYKTRDESSEEITNSITRLIQTMKRK